ncbi:MAG: winged helix-turn-helix transcriptional regulator [Coriobacteriia bacterium]|nr:winged helix-turn-helix transcriptional regulator [Coriobacteriia bacterium]MBN2840352.1 winged helix-turn-helix transcriptional regulator [Coriobacteriia bacterium]
MDQSEFFCLHSDLCKTLASAKRQMILSALRDGEITVTEIHERTAIPQATLSQHLAILRSSGVVRTRREGNRIFYAITNPKIIQAFDLITEVMQDIIDGRKDVADGTEG